MICDGGRSAKKGEQKTIDLKKYPHKVLPLQNVDHNGTLAQYPDMVRLPYLHEAGILYNLKARHMTGKPYTRTGDIIIAVNPFQWFHDLYTEKKRKYYSNRLVWETSDNDPRDSMEPHVYEVSALAYKGLATNSGDQSILVSGESGAGKTETVKICMNHIASVQKGNAINLDDEDDLDPVVRRVVDSNPLLEAFGNAKTLRNDNSSRFGKYLQLQFDKMEGNSLGGASRCTLAGSKCDVYLLEKNRVTGHHEKERTYHIFYQLLAAPDSEKQRFWSHLVGKGNKDFKYVGHTDTTKIEGMTDGEHFTKTCETLELVGVGGTRLEKLMKAISIVMQCGNLTFGAYKGDTDKSEVTSSGELKALAELMGLSTQDVTLAFTERTMKTKNETYKVPLNPNAARDSCDAFAKEVYGRIFLWVVREINKATCAEDNYKDGTHTNDFSIISLLDIFGFESFQVNRFEQLCINYANEKLQQKFTEYVFRAVQLEYESEGIELAEITYDDNTDVLDLIEGRTGLLAMLNEECVRPGGSDFNFVQKALQQNKKSPCLIVNMQDRMSFGIHHYAGKVMYDSDQFVTRNQDTLPTDLANIADMTDNEIVNTKVEELEKLEQSSGRRAPPKRQQSNLVAPTVWTKYQTQLKSLMKNLRKTHSRYIRCIKPNMKKVPNIMEHIPTVEQLRCAGVVAAVTLARSAFPNRLDNSAVRFRYSNMWDKNVYPSKKTNSSTPQEAAKFDADAILTCALKCKEFQDDKGNMKKAFVVGKTKSYFRAGALEYLESNRQTGLDAQATTLQRFARGFLARLSISGSVRDRVERERAEREARERAIREAREKEERQRQKRAEERAAKRQKYEDKIKQLEAALEEADEDKKRRIQEANDRRDRLEKEIEDLKEQTSDEARKAMMEPKKIAAQQKKKLEEQTKVIDFLKKENKKIRKDHDKAKDKYDVVKTNNDKLIRANEETGDDFEVANEAASKVNQKNEDLIDTLEKAKKDNKSLKDSCMKRQDDYMTQAETRLEYQKTMARILKMIQDTSKEAQVVEDTVVIALECEAESKAIMAALEAEEGY